MTKFLQHLAILTACWAMGLMCGWFVIPAPISQNTKQQQAGNFSQPVRVTAPAPVLLPWGDASEEPPIITLPPVEPIELPGSLSKAADEAALAPIATSPQALNRVEVALEAIESRLSLEQPVRIPKDLVEEDKRFSRPTTHLENEDHVEIGFVWSLDQEERKVKPDDEAVGGALLKALAKDDQKAQPPAKKKEPKKPSIWDAEPARQ